MKDDLPKIIIKYNRLLDPIFTFYCQNNPGLKKLGWNDWQPPSEKTVLERIKQYEREWRKYEKKILTGICTATGLGFSVDRVYAHIVSGNPRQISHPLVIKSGFIPSEFVNVLTHELIHQIFVFNNSDKNIYKQKYINGEIMTVKRHVIVHAIMKYIFLDILNEPARLKTSIESAEKHSSDDYIRAWAIVETIGYKKIINDLKNNSHPVFRKLSGS